MKKVDSLDNCKHIGKPVAFRNKEDGQFYAGVLTAVSGPSPGSRYLGFNLTVASTEGSRHFTLEKALIEDIWVWD